jgi:short-subunit dehydrogenase
MRARTPRVAPSAVVTGGAGGLGSAFTAALATAGYDVIPVDVRDTERTLDVTDPVACRALADDVQPVVWVNNAGLTGRGDVLDQTDAEIEAMVAVNLLGVIHGSRAAARSMLAGAGGTILNVASLAGWAPTPHIAAYSATKHGVRAFSVAFAAELRRTSVAVRCLLPDGIRTPMVDVDDPRQLMSFTGRRLLEPSEVAAAGMRLLRSGRLLGSVPPRRGVTPRLLGLSPGLSLALQRPVERRARRHQRRAAARRTVI